jgi:uncharacterized membrane protein YvbJ
MAKANDDLAKQLKKSIKNQKNTMIISLIFIMITVGLFIWFMSANSKKDGYGYT